MDDGGDDENYLLIFEFGDDETLDNTVPRSKSHLDSVALHQSLKAEMEELWAKLIAGHFDEGIYGFGFFSNEGQGLVPTVFTETSYEQARESTNEPDWVARWSTGDSALHLVDPNALAVANEIIFAAREAAEEAEDFDDEEAPGRHIEAVYEVAQAVLCELRDEGHFDPLPDLLVNLWTMEHGRPQPEHFAYRCNPPAVAERFCSEERM